MEGFGSGTVLNWKSVASQKPYIVFYISIVFSHFQSVVVVSAYFPLSSSFHCKR